LQIAAAWLAPSIFNIGDESATDVFLLFALVFGSILFSNLEQQFHGFIICIQPVRPRNYVNITNIGLQVIFVVILFFWLGPFLPLVGISYLLAGISSTGTINYFFHIV